MSTGGCVAARSVNELMSPVLLCSTLFVVGAGRGPLVAGCLRAAERSRRKLILTAVEKNPSAFVMYAVLPSARLTC